MSTPPARCCVQTLKGTRCANEPSPVRPVRMIGPVRLAACGLEAHQRALWSLPGFVRHDAYCGAFGCDRPSNAGICQKHRDMYRDFGITEHMLLAPQEAPMTPAPPSKLPELGFARVQIQASSASLADLEAAATGMTIPTPPAAPQEAADGGATPDDPCLWDEARWALCYSRDSGFAPALWFSVAKEEQEVYMRVVMERMAKSATPSPEAPKPAPADDAARWRPMTAAEVEAALDTIMPLDVPAEVTAGIRDRATAPGTDGESDGEPSVGDVDDALDSYPGGFATSPPAFGPTPGPTVADLQAELKEATRLSECRRKEVQRRGDALARMEATLKKVEDERDTLRGGIRKLWEEMTGREYDTSDVEEADLLPQVQVCLAAITEALDPEDAPAFDSDDQPIPLPVRVQTALMPDTTYERELRKSLHAVEAELFEVDRALQHLGAYGNGPTIDQLLKVLTPEDRRNILELQAAEARLDLARLKASRLNPPPPEKLAEYAAKVAEVEAKLAALDR